MPNMREILSLPCVMSYELYDEPLDFDDLVEMCGEFEEYDNWQIGISEPGRTLCFPIGDAILDPDETLKNEPVYHQCVAVVQLMQESPIMFQVSDSTMKMIDYGVVEGMVLNIYREVMV